VAFADSFVFFAGAESLSVFPLGLSSPASSSLPRLPLLPAPLTPHPPPPPFPPFALFEISPLFSTYVVALPWAESSVALSLIQPTPGLREAEEVFLFLDLGRAIESSYSNVLFFSFLVREAVFFYFACRRLRLPTGFSSQSALLLHLFSPCFSSIFPSLSLSRA